MCHLTSWLLNKQSLFGTTFQLIIFKTDYHLRRKFKIRLNYKWGQNHRKTKQSIDMNFLFKNLKLKN